MQNKNENKTQNCVMLSRFCSASQPLTWKQRDPEQRHFRMAPSFGFTLIELLVVVLIIGILAAVALPQYQVSVDKTRYTTMMAATRAVKNEQELYYLANGSYSTDMHDFAGTLPASCTITSNARANCGNFNMSLESERVYSDMSTPHTTLIMRYSQVASVPNLIRCVANKDGGERARRVCKSLGGKAEHADNEGCNGNCTVYRLQ